MIHNIAIENFRSIADRQELNFAVPANTPDLTCFRTLTDKDIRLPTVIGFFGPNASGKSNVLHAIVSSIVFACNSFNMENAGMMFQPYRHKDWWDKPTKITIDFDGRLKENISHAMFRYELHIAHAAKKIIYEALLVRTPHEKYRRLFERKGQRFYFGDEFGISNHKDDPRKEAIGPKFSVISTLAKLNHPIAINIVKQMSTFLIGRFNEQDINELLHIYYRNQDLSTRLNKELRRLDVGLESMHIEQGPQGLYAKFKHTGLDNLILWGEESTGTQRFIEIFPRLYYALEIGGVAIVDEIDMAVHPLLLPELFRWFNSAERNPHNAQLLFTAHNPAALDELEKEQIFFTEKPWGQSKTQVFGARDIKGLRREPSLMKKYLSGELGAVPHIG